jgi:hypothetical protein
MPVYPDAGLLQSRFQPGWSKYLPLGAFLGTFAGGVVE